MQIVRFLIQPLSGTNLKSLCIGFLVHFKFSFAFASASVTASIYGRKTTLHIYSLLGYY